MALFMALMIGNMILDLLYTHFIALVSIFMGFFSFFVIIVIFDLNRMEMFIINI
jgi:hypothetical protein